MRAALTEVAIELAQAIVRDGEGATKFITVARRGRPRRRRVPAASRSAIAHSPLVKTAFFASDPNLGRIVCAIGNAGVADLDPAGVSFWLDDVLVVDRGGRAASYREEDGQRVMKQDEITVRVDLGRGDAAATRLDLRPLARLRQRSTPTTAADPRRLVELRARDTPG